MFGKMMNNFYYGKSGKGDYRKEDLPKNRWQLFFEVLKVRFASLVKLNLLYVLLWIPAIILTAMTVLAWSTQLSALTETYADSELIAQTANMTSSLVFSYLVMLIPCLIITGPWTAGISFVTRNWARDEHSFIWSDFKDAVKENWKHALITSAITSIMPFLVYIGYRTYGEMATTSGVFFVVPQMLILILGLVWSLVTIYMYPLMVTYKLTYKQTLRNALLLAIGRLPQNLGLRILSLLPAFIALVFFFFTGQLPIILLVLIALYAFILFALNRFIYASYSNAVFDKFINPNIEGAQVNRGLSQETDDDDDDDDDDIDD